MNPRLKQKNQRGFSLIEMLIAIIVMLVVTSAVFSLMGNSMKVANATYEMTDVQETLRTAQEYVNRDLMNAGDGLKTVSIIRIPQAFVTSYLTRNPIVDADMPAGIINLGILTSDNNVPVATAVLGSNPATTVRQDTDRQTIIEIDSEFIAITPSAVDPNGTWITLPAGTDMNLFQTGEIYYLSSSVGGAFGTITGVTAGTRTLSFAVGGADVYGLNLAGANNNIKVISTDGTVATSLQRMKIIHYYVNADGMLMRRVFGVRNAGFRESIIAEHVLNVQFNYSLDMTDAAGNVVQPTATLSTKAQRLGIRAVEVMVSVETPHALQNGLRTRLSMTTSTTVRNMQFRRAHQPNASGN